MSKLTIQLYLELHGLGHIVDSYHLECKEKGDLVLLKYNQIESDMSEELVRECRGIILDSSKNWAIVSYPFYKFFNIEEGHAAKIDWDTARVYDKADGSMIQLYWYDNKWNVATSGTIDGHTQAHDSEFTFADLFWYTIKKQYESVEKFMVGLNKHFCYVFELCTPYNIVVTQHQECKTYLLGARNLLTLEEVPVESFKDVFDVIGSCELKDVESIRETFKNMTWQQEGYVVCDAGFNRVKIKNPAYVGVHHLKGRMGMHHMMDVIKTNETDEFCVYFKERAEECLRIKEQYAKLEMDLSKMWTETLQSGSSFETQKDFALKVQKEIERPFQGLMFALKNGKCTDISQWLREQDNRFLYEYLKAKIKADEVVELQKIYKKYLGLSIEELYSYGWFMIETDPTDKFFTERSIYHQRPFTFEEFINTLHTDGRLKELFFDEKVQQ